MTVSIARLSTEAGVSYLLKTTSHADVETRDGGARSTSAVGDAIAAAL